MQHNVKIKTIPAGLQFPAHLQSKIHLDKGRNELVFQGFMSKSDYDQLLRISRDVPYQTAIAQLFQLSTVSDAPQLRQLGRVLAGLTIACLLLSAIVWWSLLRGVPAKDNNPASAVTPTNDSVETEQLAQNLHSER